MKIFVGNLAATTTSDELRELFSGFGQVSSAEVVKNFHTGESKGFGFVEMPAKAEARSAIRGLDLKELNGRSMTVNKSRPSTGRGRR